jgi:hypothetical protein
MSQQSGPSFPAYRQTKAGTQAGRSLSHFLTNLGLESVTHTRRYVLQNTDRGSNQFTIKHLTFRFFDGS